jgi:hypothetical protein
MPPFSDITNDSSGRGTSSASGGASSSPSRGGGGGAPHGAGGARLAAARTVDGAAPAAEDLRARKRVLRDELWRLEKEVAQLQAQGPGHSAPPLSQDGDRHRHSSGGAGAGGGSGVRGGRREEGRGVDAALRDRRRLQARLYREYKEIKELLQLDEGQAHAAAAAPAAGRG